MDMNGADVSYGLSALTISASDANQGTTRANAARPIVDLLRPLARADGRGRDITAVFTNACAALQQGELIKDDFFTLFESVSALEIMDPKMDSGVTLPEKDAAMENFDPLDISAPEEIIWIMDELLSFEMAWHDGYPLSQTLFTSLHLNSLLRSGSLPLEELSFRTRRPLADAATLPLVTNILRAYCLSLVKCCDHVIQEIVNEHFYEEEDFITANFTRDLLSNIDENELLELLDKAAGSIDSIDIPPKLQEAIKIRLLHRGKLLQAVRPSDVDLESSKPRLFSELQAISADLENTHDLAKSPSCQIFSERVQRYLASNTPPRPIKQLPWPEAIAKLQKLADDVKAAFEVRKLATNFDPHALMRMTWEFSSRTPQPLTYPRAVMQGILFRTGAVLSQYPHIDLFLSDLRNLVLPASPLLDPMNWGVEAPGLPRHQIARRIDDFVTRSMEEYLNLYRMALQNRCRIRRTFAQSIAILDSLQAMAEEADADIKAACRTSLSTREPIHDVDENFYPLAAWLYHHKLSTMEVVVQMGFELEVYLPDELASSYALLHYFAQTRYEHSCTIFNSIERRRAHVPSRSASSSKVEMTSALAYLNSLALQAQVKSLLSSALAQVCSTLALLGLLPVLARPQSTPELRHELRLKPFLPIGTPTLPTQSDLDALLCPSGPEERLDAMLAYAEERCQAAKGLITKLKGISAEEGRFAGVEEGWARELKGMMFVAIGVGVACASLKGAYVAVGAVTIGDVAPVTSGQAPEHTHVVRSVTKDGVAEDLSCRDRLRASVVVELPLPEARMNPWWVVPKITVKRA